MTLTRIREYEFLAASRRGEPDSSTAMRRGEPGDSEDQTPPLNLGRPLCHASGAMATQSSKIITHSNAYRFEIPRVLNGRLAVRAEAGRGVIEIFDVIGGEQVNPTTISAALAQLGNLPALVKINSPGGDFYAGNTIYNLLRAHRPGVTVQVLGIAASAASVIAMAGNTIEIARSAEIMIHRAWLVAIGNVDTMDQAAKMLRQIDASMVDIYAARTGQKPARVAELMAAETFMTSSEAIKLGFVDRLLEQDGPAALQIAPGGAPPSSLRTFEAALRDQLGMSKSAAERVALAGWRALGGAPAAADSTPDFSKLAAAIERGTTSLRAANQRRL